MNEWHVAGIGISDQGGQATEFSKLGVIRGLRVGSDKRQ